MLRRATSADGRIGWTFSLATGLLIVWACFLAFVTWLDWLGVLTFLVAILPLWLSQGMYFLLVIVLLIWLRAVLGSAHRSRLARSVLALSIVWLLVLPFIPWTSEKALLIQSSRIQRGMTEAEVRTIMGSYQTNPHLYTRANGVEGLTFCYDDVCNSTAEVDFVFGQVVRVWYDLD
jgi:hypothetical protein